MKSKVIKIITNASLIYWFYAVSVFLYFQFQDRFNLYISDDSPSYVNFSFKSSIDIVWLFGLCYVMDGGYKGCNPYIERHLAIFVNCFLSRAN
jgi:hypothetical protein